MLTPTTILVDCLRNSTLAEGHVRIVKSLRNAFRVSVEPRFNHLIAMKISSARRNQMSLAQRKPEVYQNISSFLRRQSPKKGRCCHTPSLKGKRAIWSWSSRPTRRHDDLLWRADSVIPFSRYACYCFSPAVCSHKSARSISGDHTNLINCWRVTVSDRICWSIEAFDCGHVVPCTIHGHPQAVRLRTPNHYDIGGPVGEHGIGNGGPRLERRRERHSGNCRGEDE